MCLMLVCAVYDDFNSVHGFDCAYICVCMYTLHVCVYVCVCVCVCVWMFNVL